MPVNPEIVAGGEKVASMSGSLKRGGKSAIVSRLKICKDETSQITKGRSARIIRLPGTIPKGGASWCVVGNE